MADSLFSGINTSDGSRDEIIKEVLAALLDAANSSRRFSEELKDNVKNASKFKRDTQNALMGMVNEAKTFTREAAEFEQTLKHINDSFPQTVKSMLDSTEKGLGFQTRKFEAQFKIDKLLNPLFNEFRLAKRQEMNDLTEEIEKLDRLLKTVGDGEEKKTFEELKAIKEKQRTELEGLDDFKVMQRQNSKFFFDQSLKIGKKVLSDLYQFALQKITSAVNNYNSTMQQTYTLIQSYNNYTVNQYDALFKRLKSSIDNAGLSDIININELQQSYANTVQGGLFGSAAEKNAYYKSIAEQAGITFDWTDSNWMKTVSRLQNSGTDLDKFMQQIITSTENMTEAAGNGFAFTGNQINTMVESLNRLQVSLNLTDDAYIAAYKSFGTAGSMLNEWGIDASKIYSDITDYAEKGITASSTAQILNMGGMTQAQIKEQISAGKTDEIVLKYLSELESRYDKMSGEFVNVASSALSESLSNEEILAYQNYIQHLSESGRSVEDEYKRIYNYNEWAYDNMVDSLSNTETATDKIANWTDNFFAELGKWANQHPIFSQVGSSLFSGASSMIGAWFGSGLARKSISTMLQKAGLSGGEFAAGGSGAAGAGMANMSGGAQMVIPGMESAVGGGAVSGGAVGGGVTKTGIAAMGSKIGGLFSNGTAFSSSSSTALQGIGKTVFSTGGKALGVAGSLISMGIDAYSGYKEGGIEGALRGSITGSGKAAESGWDVAKGAGSGALKGAGIGMAFGPWGAAIGAAVGGLAGLAITVHDLNDEELKYQRSVEKAYSGIQDLSKATNDAVKATNEFKKSMSDIDSLEKTLDSFKEGEKPTEEMLKKYPQLNRYLDANGNITKEYTDELTKTLEIEKQLNLIKYKAALRESVKDRAVNEDGKSPSENYDTLVKDTNKKKTAYYDAMEENSKREEFEKLWYDADKLSVDKNNNIVITSSDGKQHKYSSDTLNSWYGAHSGVLLELARHNEKESYADVQDNGYYVSTEFGSYYVPDTTTTMYEADFGKQQTTKRADDAKKAWTDAGTKDKEALTALKNEIFQFNTDLHTLEFDDVLAGKLTLDNMAYGAFIGTLSDTKSGSFRNMAWNYNENIKRAKIDKTFADQNNLYYPSVIKKAIEDAGYKPAWTPVFAVGTTGDSTIPYDNYLALLHKGEQIRTSADVSLERAEQHIASSEAIGNLNTSVLKQTDTIIGLLTQILNVTTTLSNRINKTPTQTYDYSAATI